MITYPAKKESACNISIRMTKTIMINVCWATTIGQFPTKGTAPTNMFREKNEANTSMTCIIIRRVCKAITIT